jgi:hypothetical protein
MELVELIECRKKKNIKRGREDLLPHKNVMRMECDRKPERIYNWAKSQDREKQVTCTPRFMWGTYVQ